MAKPSTETDGEALDRDEAGSRPLMATSSTETDGEALDRDHVKRDVFH